MPASTTPSTSRAAPRSSPASYDNAKIVNRFDLTKRLVARLEKDEAVIGGIGNTNFDLWSAGRRPQTSTCSAAWASPSRSRSGSRSPSRNAT